MGVSKLEFPFRKTFTTFCTGELDSFVRKDDFSALSDKQNFEEGFEYLCQVHFK